jgi:serine/threonine protein kinase
VLDDFNPKCQKYTRIGKGGFGSVYKEECLGGELWAVKVLSKHDPRFKRKWEMLGDIAMSARLMQQESSRLYSDFPSNEYFVKLLGWNYNNDYILIAMEHIALGDLEENLMSGWSEEEVKTVTRQLLYGLQVMHSRDITHRDLKPKVCWSIHKYNVFIYFC